ncbi:MAG: hypothetical protein ACXVHQ_38150 [Solirubrobacteraceae bacterium]
MPTEGTHSLCINKEKDGEQSIKTQPATSPSPANGSTSAETEPIR